jgi:hypothetical protein
VLHFLTTARQVLGGSQRFHIAHLPNFLSNRAFIIADSNKRRALSRADIAKVLAKSDFLVDIVLREEGLQYGIDSRWCMTGAVAGGSGSGMTNLAAGVRVTNTTCRTSQ